MVMYAQHKSILYILASEHNSSGQSLHDNSQDNIVHKTPSSIWKEYMSCDCLY